MTQSALDPLTWRDRVAQVLCLLGFHRYEENVFGNDFRIGVACWHCGKPAQKEGRL